MSVTHYQFVANLASSAGAPPQASPLEMPAELAIANHSRKPYMQETRQKNLLICRRNVNVKRAKLKDTSEVEGHTSGIEYHVYRNILIFNTLE